MKKKWSDEKIAVKKKQKKTDKQTVVEIDTMVFLRRPISFILMQV